MLLQSLYFFAILFCLFISLNRLPLTLIPNTETIHWSFLGSPGAVAIIEPFACGCLLASVPCCWLWFPWWLQVSIKQIPSVCWEPWQSMLFSQRQHNKAHSACWGLVQSPIWLYLWHFSIKLASAVCSVRLTSDDTLLGRRSTVHLILSFSLGPLKEIICSNEWCPFSMDWKLSAWS